MTLIGYTMMSEQEWRGAPLRQILVAETSAFADRVSLDGIDLMVRQKAAQSFALILLCLCYVRCI